MERDALDEEAAAARGRDHVGHRRHLAFAERLEDAAGAVVVAADDLVDALRQHQVAERIHRVAEPVDLGDDSRGERSARRRQAGDAIGIGLAARRSRAGRSR